MQRTVLFLSLLSLCTRIDGDNENVSQYISYTFEWHREYGHEWLSQSHSAVDNNELIACAQAMPSLCIYASKDKPGFQLFDDDEMYDFLDDEQWSTVSVLVLINNEPHTSSYMHRRRLKDSSSDDKGKRKRSRKKSRRRRSKRWGHKLKKWLRRRGRRRRSRRNGDFWKMSGGFGPGGSGPYGCLRAYCYTVMGTPRIIRPHVHRMRVPWAHQKHPAFMFVPTTGMMPHPYSMGYGGYGGYGMGGMGMGMGMGGMGMGGMGMGGGGMLGGLASMLGGDRSGQGSIQYARRRLAGEEEEEKLVVDHSVYKTIQKCIIKESKRVCVTYYYLDDSISVECDVGNNAHALTQSVAHKYHEMYVWIWDKHTGENCNKNLWPKWNLELCVEYDDDHDHHKLILQVNDGVEKESVAVQASNRQEWTKIYNIERIENHESIFTQRLCRPVEVKKSATSWQLCVETNINSDEIEISIQHNV